MLPLKLAPFIGTIHIKLKHSERAFESLVGEQRRPKLWHLKNMQLINP